MSIQKEILIYRNLPPSKLRFITYLAAAQGGFLLANLFSMPTKITEEPAEKKKKEENLNLVAETPPVSTANATSSPITSETSLRSYKDIYSWRNLMKNLNERPLPFASLLVASFVVIGTASVLARRMVHMITLLPNKRVRFTLFSQIPFTKPSSIEVPLSHVHCQVPRETKRNYSILKLKDYTGYHLVSRKEGEFLEPELYDKCLGFARSWAK